jgi:leader peptidase (prepilin peptidase)/N-methyltransferase
MSPLYWEVYWTVAMFLLGACVGSFLNVCIYRLPAGLSIVWPPSHCPKCQKRIAAYDNLPILSWFILRGRCRQCGQKFSIEYAAVEFFTAALFVGFYYALMIAQVRGPELAHWGVYATYMALVAALLVSSVIDFKTKEIYTVVTNGGMIVAVAACAIFPDLMSQSFGPHWFQYERLNAVVLSLLGLAVGGGIIWITRILGRLAFRREAMGFGDVLLMGLIGAALGWEAALAVFFIAPFFGLVYGLWRLFRHQDNEVPYGPFLSLAAGVVMLAQTTIVHWFTPGLKGFWQVVFTHGNAVN